MSPLRTMRKQGVRMDGLTQVLFDINPCAIRALFSQARKHAPFGRFLNTHPTIPLVREPFKSGPKQVSRWNEVELIFPDRSN